VIAQLTSGRVLVLETQQGILLWERMLGEAGSLTGPVVGDGRAVFFSALHGLPPRALVLDLFRGRVVADFPLSGLESNEPLETTAWIAGHRLIAPAFAHPSRISAFSLADGERAWTLDFGRDEVLQSLAYYQDRSFPVTRGTGATDPSAGKNEKNGSVYELEETSGTLKRIVPLKQGERPMGLEGRSRIELASSYLFSYSTSDKDKGVSIRAIHLQNGVQWTWSLPVSSQEFYDGPSLSMPAVSADCVAISYRTRASRGGPISDSTVVFVDMRAGNAGKKLDQLFLGEAFDAAQSLELHGLGEALFVLGRAVGPRGSCLEILEKVR